MNERLIDTDAKGITKKMIATIIAMIPFALITLPIHAEEPDGNEIIAEMDRRMNFIECKMIIRIVDEKADGKTRELKARVEYLKDVGTRIDFEEPVRDRGKCVLMSGTSMWMSSPSVAKPVRLSGKDAFMGTSFTNDDVMNLDKADDYESAITASDAGGWNITMTAKKASLPYPRIEARIARDFLPTSMSYFARSGKESKRVKFSAVKDYGGKPRPSVMAIVDLMKPGDTSSVIFDVIREEPLNRSRLTPAALGN